MGKGEGALCYRANPGRPAWHPGMLPAGPASWVGQSRASSQRETGERLHGALRGGGPAVAGVPAVRAFGS
jgi:hypothetical protein